MLYCYRGRRVLSFLLLGIALVSLIIFTFIRRSEVDVRWAANKSRSRANDMRHAVFGNDEPDSTPTCYPHRNVVFIKTHKCASSSVQNILMRFCKAMNPTLALPKAGISLGWPDKFHPHFVRGAASGNRFNMLLHHSVYNRRQMEPLTLPDTRYITIIRNPADVLRSTYHYYRLDAHLGVDLHEFLRRPEFYTSQRLNALLHVAKVAVRNSLLVDLGILPLNPLSPDHTDERLVQRAIDTIEKEFDLVMVAEHFDESLVLLRELLCWKWSDMVVFKLNVRREDPGATKDIARSSVDGAAAEWNRLDHIFYQHFLKLFQEKLLAFDLTVHSSPKQ